MENYIFKKVFHRRSVISLVVILILFFGCVLRITALSTNKYMSAGLSNNRLKLTVSKQRGTIFDCNMIPITNREKKIIAAVSPTPRAITAISSVLEGEALENVLERLKRRKPVLTEIDSPINCDGIVCVEVYEHQTSETAATHLIGYADNDLNGVSGIQKAYNDLLYSESEVSISFECDGKGNVLEGVAPEVYKDSTVESQGVVSTIDINLQNIVQDVSKHIETGAIIMADAHTAKIRACVSIPQFNCTKPEDYLNSKDSPLFNRALNAYNVGSVFKPCVAIAAIENESADFLYNCVGSCEIADRRFKCHDFDGHGLMNLKTATANSCNTYFYNLAIHTGKDSIYNTACALRFGKSLKLCENLFTASGNLPDKQSLNNKAYLANLSIGQGELLLSPISILPLYCAIASNGTYHIPSVVEGTVTDGSLKPYNIGNPTRIMQNSTAKTLKNYLELVLLEGTGESAKPKTVTAAGKTATAQTGKYQNGAEICQGWFCGYFPAENPRYVVVVFSENILRQSKSCGEVFSIIADQTANLKNLQ